MFKLLITITALMAGSGYASNNEELLATFDQAYCLATGAQKGLDLVHASYHYNIIAKQCAGKDSLRQSMVHALLNRATVNQMPNYNNPEIAVKCYEQIIKETDTAVLSAADWSNVQFNLAFLLLFKVPNPDYARIRSLCHDVLANSQARSLEKANARLLLVLSMELPFDAGAYESRLELLSHDPSDRNCVAILASINQTPFEAIHNPIYLLIQRNIAIFNPSKNELMDYEFTHKISLQRMLA